MSVSVPVGIFATADLLALGVTRRVLGCRLRDGRWQRVLPGVIATHNGPLPAEQRRLAGLAYAGRTAVLSHRSAGTVLGLRVVERQVELTLPPGHHRRDAGFVVVHQSKRVPTAVLGDRLRCTPVARTVVDIACTMRWLDDVRALVSDSVQRRLTTVERIAAEAELAPRHSPALLRRALAEVGAGARSAGECAFLALVIAAGLPMPELGAPVVTPGGCFLLDALWREHRVGVEIDGQAWHLGAAEWRRDLRRQNLVVGTGITLLRFPVTRLRDDPAGVIGELRVALSP